MNFKRLAVCGWGVCAIIAGCATTTGPVPGPRQSATPPKLVKINEAISWDDPTRFGPVPAELARNAGLVCGGLDTRDVKYKATGYHAKAMDLSGTPIPGGGFYCVQK